MTDPFDTALAFTLEHEGGFSNNPADPGGRTIYGISEKAHPDLWRNGPPTLDQAKARYRRDYWTKIRGFDLPPRVAMVLFDFSVHSGVSNAVSELQRLVGTARDGILGPKTAAAVRGAAPLPTADRVLAFRLLASRALFQGRWIAAVATRAQFAPGFMRRIAELGALVARA